MPCRHALDTPSTRPKNTKIQNENTKLVCDGLSTMSVVMYRLVCVSPFDENENTRIQNLAETILRQHSKT
jgi:hypothetical protein